MIAMTASCVSLFAQWSKVTVAGLPSGSGISTLYTDNNTLWAGGIGKIFRSGDGGETWAEVSTGLQSAISGNSGITRLDNRVYACFSGNGNWYTYYTTDEGQNWNIDTAGWVGPAPIQLHTHKEYVLARLESNYILYKKNTDATWNVLNVPEGFRTPGALYSVGDTLVLGAGNIALTTDMGATWTTRQTVWPQGYPLGFVNRVFQDRDNPSILFANYQVLATGKGFLIQSKDNQVTWDSIHILQDFPALATSMWVKGNNVYLAYGGSFTAGDTLTKVFNSSNGGQSWTNITENLFLLTQFKFHSLTSMEVLNGNLFAGGFSSAGIVKRATGSTGLKEVHSYRTLTLYPNPAADFVVVDEQADFIVITDLSGKVVMKPLAAGGKVDVSGLSQGLYLVHAQKGDRVFTGKLVKH